MAVRNVTLALIDNEEFTVHVPPTLKKLRLDNRKTISTDIKPAIKIRINSTLIGQSLPRDYIDGNNKTLLIIGGVTAIISLMSILFTCFLIYKRDKRIKQETEDHIISCYANDGKNRTESFFENYKAGFTPTSSSMQIDTDEQKDCWDQETYDDKKYKIYEHFVLENTPPSGYFSAAKELEIKDTLKHSNSDHAIAKRKKKSSKKKEKRRKTWGAKDLHGENQRAMHYGIYNEHYESSSCGSEQSVVY